MGCCSESFSPRKFYYVPSRQPLRAKPLPRKQTQRSHLFKANTASTGSKSSSIGKNLFVLVKATWKDVGLFVGKVIGFGLLLAVALGLCGGFLGVGIWLGLRKRGTSRCRTAGIVTSAGYGVLLSLSLSPLVSDTVVRFGEWGAR